MLVNIFIFLSYLNKIYDFIGPLSIIGKIWAVSFLFGDFVWQGVWVRHYYGFKFDWKSVWEIGRFGVLFGFLLYWVILFLSFVLLYIF